jgi:ABC-2 type transport system permease protein
MLSTIFRINWLNLKRDRIALGLTFVLPLIFFSIFAFIFGSMAESSGAGGGAGPMAMKVVVVDDDQSDISRRFVKAIDDQDALDVVVTQTPRDGEVAAPFDRAAAVRAVRGGKNPAAIIIPRGFSTTFGNFAGEGAGGRSEVEVIYDESNPIAQHTVSGLLQAAAMMAAPDILMERGFDQLGQFGSGGALTPTQRELIDRIRPFLRGDRPWEELDEDGSAATQPGATTAPSSSDSPAAGFTGMVSVKATGAREGDAATTQDGERAVSKSSIIAYYAAGIGVMFLLFSMAGASGFLLEQEEMGALERLLTANVGMTRLLAGSWLFFALIGMAQLATMFAFAALVFGLELFTPNHLAGCAVMIPITALAGAAFAMILATLARSRAQLGGMSTIIILIMSALGGSMVPRFVAPGVFEKTAPFTFNGWALDGFLNVFWFDDPAHTLPQSLATLAGPVAALAAMTVVFLVIARLLARRWEAA